MCPYTLFVFQIFHRGENQKVAFGPQVNLGIYSGSLKLKVWEQRILACINENTPNAVPAQMSTSTIKRHFRIVRKLRRKGRPKQKKKKNKTKNEKKKKVKVQSTMQSFFQPNQQLTNADISSQDITENNQLENNEPENEPKAKISPCYRQRKRKQIDDIDNYKIVRRTNMITYLRRIQTY